MSLYVNIPVLILSGFIIPLIVLYFLVKINRTKNTSFHKKKRNFFALRFVSQGYKKSCFFWEFIIMLEVYFFLLKLFNKNIYIKYLNILIFMF